MFKILKIYVIIGHIQFIMSHEQNGITMKIMLNTAMVQILNCLLYFQVILASWEMTLLLVLVKIVVAGAFGVNISRKVTEERSTLRREFYIKFAKVSVDLVLYTYILWYKVV